MRESFRFLARHPELPVALHRKVALFRQEVTEQGLAHSFIPSLSPIQVLRIGGNARTKGVAAHLQAAGYDVRPILSPTVREGEERLRICLHTYSPDEAIAALVRLLAAALQPRNVQPAF